MVPEGMARTECWFYLANDGARCRLAESELYDIVTLRESALARRSRGKRIIDLHALLIVVFNIFYTSY